MATRSKTKGGSRYVRSKWEGGWRVGAHNERMTAILGAADEEGWTDGWLSVFTGFV